MMYLHAFDPMGEQWGMQWGYSLRKGQLNRHTRYRPQPLPHETLPRCVLSFTHFPGFPARMILNSHMHASITSSNFKTVSAAKALTTFVKHLIKHRKSIASHLASACLPRTRSVGYARSHSNRGCLVRSYEQEALRHAAQARRRRHHPLADAPCPAIVPVSRHRAVSPV